MPVKSPPDTIAQAGKATSRDSLAQKRTVLANQRTFSAWLRTGLSAEVAGIGIAKLLESPRFNVVATAIGLVFITIGAAAYAIALWNYRRECRSLAREGVCVGLPVWVLTLLVALFLLSVLLAISVLFMQGR